MMSVKVANIVVILILIVLSLAIVANSMSKPLGRDEQMYCTGSALLAQGKMIYRDFSYAAQLPYHPLLCAVLLKIFNTTHYLLVGRILSAFFDIFVLVCIFGIYRYIFKSFAITGMILGLAGTVLYIFNPLVDYANGYAWNHDAVIFCVVLAFWIFVSTDFSQKSKYLRIVIIGVLLTFASFMRMTTVLVGLLFLAIILSQPAETIKQRFKTILPFLIATAAISAWPILVIAQAPRAFFLNLIKIPTLYGEWLHRIGMVFNKFDLTLTCFTQPAYFVILVLGIYLCLITLYLRRRLQITNVRALLLAALLPLTFLIIAQIPPTMWRQYLAMPVPFLVTGFALPLLYLRKLADKSSAKMHFKIAAGLVGVCVFVTVTSYPFVLYRTPIVLAPERWEPIEIHKISEDIAERTKEPKLILTLGPLLALEGGCNIYPELSCGAIIYRAADSLSASERSITHTVGPKTIGELLEKSSPSAVLLGVERGKLSLLEAPLKAVVKPDWERKDYKNGFVAYFKP